MPEDEKNNVIPLFGKRKPEARLEARLIDEAALLEKEGEAAAVLEFKKNSMADAAPDKKFVLNARVVHRAKQNAEGMFRIIQAFNRQEINLGDLRGFQTNVGIRRQVVRGFSDEDLVRGILDATPDEIARNRAHFMALCEEFFYRFRHFP